jgi:hypothetical protein
MLPEMSALQFLVVRLLFAGAQSGSQLRERMREAGVKIGPPAFSRLMDRMENANYLCMQTEEGPKGCRYVRPRRFVVTELGVALWRQARAFYAAGGEPPAELVTIATEEARLAHLPRRQRRAIIRRRVERQMKGPIMRYLRALARNGGDGGFADGIDETAEDAEG